MEFTADGIVLDKPLNLLDELLLDVADVLEEHGVAYAAVSGYVAILFGRSRATEDIDVLIRPPGEDVLQSVADSLRTAGFWGPTRRLDDMADTLEEGLPIRIAPEDRRVPNVELKTASSRYDRASIDQGIDVQLADRWLRIGSLELQIADKLDMGAEHDFEDAVHLLAVFEDRLNRERLEGYVTEFGVEEEYARLRS